MAFVEKKFVEVAFVVVEFVTFNPLMMEFKMFSFEAKKFVVVADVPVELRNVKFCKVDEPVTARLEVVAVPKIVRPWVPLPRVVEAETMRPTVEVGAI